MMNRAETNVPKHIELKRSVADGVYALADGVKWSMKELGEHINTDMLAEMYSEMDVVKIMHYTGTALKEIFSLDGEGVIEQKDVRIAVGNMRKDFLGFRQLDCYADLNLDEVVKEHYIVSRNEPDSAATRALFHGMRAFEDGNNRVWDVYPRMDQENVRLDTQMMGVGKNADDKGTMMLMSYGAIKCSYRYGMSRRLMDRKEHLYVVPDYTGLEVSNFADGHVGAILLRANANCTFMLMDGELKLSADKTKFVDERRYADFVVRASLSKAHEMLLAFIGNAVVVSKNKLVEERYLKGEMVFGIWDADMWGKLIDLDPRVRDRMRFKNHAITKHIKEGWYAELQKYASRFEVKSPYVEAFITCLYDANAANDKATLALLNGRISRLIGCEGQGYASSRSGTTKASSVLSGATAKVAMRHKASKTYDVVVRAIELVMSGLDMKELVDGTKLQGEVCSRVMARFGRRIPQRVGVVDGATFILAMCALLESEIV
jgi:hypothetical protein